MRTEADKWFNRIVRDSKHNDKNRKRRIDPEQPYIDTPTLIGFQKKQENLKIILQILSAENTQ